MDNQSGHVMTLANSIIGVSVLAMPYCFKQCGIVLSVLMLLISSIISRLACHFLLKSAIIARRRTFEFLAFYIFGAMGKFAIEIGIIGFLIGTCIAFFVVMGDLAPEIITEITGIYTTNAMRTSILMALALFCVLPLGLLRNVDSLNGVSKATIGFYCCLVLNIVFEAIPHIFRGDWFSKVVFWRPAGIMQCLPIFSMALFCQTQLFEIYQALPNATLEKMNNLVRVAVNICTWVYIFVGVFGYIAFSQKPFTGNILMSFSPSLVTDLMKIGFVLSVAFSFPLVIFPCRASLYTLLYKEGYSLHEGMSNYIPEGKFKGLTMLIVFISLIIGIMIPSIELVLGLVGSTIGVMICVIFPVTCFICISPKNTNERILAQLMLMVGIFVMVLGTYKNLYTLDNLEPNTVTISSLNNLEQLNLNVAKAVEEVEMKKNIIEKIPTTVKIVKVVADIVKIDQTTLKVMENDQIKEIRHEPPQPVQDQPISVPVEPDKADVKKLPETFTKNGRSEPVKKAVNESKVDQKNDEVDIEAIKKEDKEVELQEKEKNKEGDNHQVLIDTIQKQNEVQKEIVEQQKKLIEAIKNQQKNVEVNDIDKVNEEKLKAVKQIESIALKAIQKISAGKDNDKLVADLEKNIKEKVEQDTKGKDELTNEHSMKNKIESIVKDNKEQNLVPLIKKDGEEDYSKGNIEQIINRNIILPEVIDQNKNVILNADNNNINVEVNVKESINLPMLNVIGVNNNREEKIENKMVEQNTINENNEQKTIAGGNNVQSQKKLATSKEDIKKYINISQPSAISNTNNTAPLFLKLGKAEVNRDNRDIKKMIPFPLAVSNSNNLSKSEPLPVVPIKDVVAEEKNVQVLSDTDVQAMRRDILSISRKK
ncbi:hypothetical protein NQ314_018212 [Rhamnusium bicolor]|uniref:Amino acid transporter transmembrane domain-containing protein n=1 Tax=Rhamnusium bicolor TaxID=1586634 RepID=A0AAV8WSI3_9CUCU|nr:hypothetical protein NQ314_018212 [Rhamnusium bicolor]